MHKFLIIFFLALACKPARAETISLYDLKIEGKENPIGIDIVSPKFSWKINSTQQNILQTAYHILVADDSLLLKKNIGNIWDSKKVNSDKSLHVMFNGVQLISAKKYFWKVKIIDNKRNSSNWSSINFWQMGLLNKNDWGNAKWIGLEEINDTAIITPHAHQSGKKAWGARRNILPQFRAVVSIEKEIKSATTFISGLGHFDFFINGKKIGNNFLDPGWTDYSKEAQYIAFDITKDLQQGQNVLGAMLGNGFFYIPSQRYRKMTGAYGLPKMICKIIIEYVDGTFSEVVTNSNWKATASPIIFSSIFGGEDYDATKTLLGWDKINYIDTAWKNVIEVKPISKLIATIQEPIKIAEIFKVKTKIIISENNFLYDFGQNFSGIPKIKAKGNIGDTIKLYCAELINDDNTVNQKATGSPSFFTYIIGSNNEETWQPQFTYTGFRYIQAKCIAKEINQPAPIIVDIKGLHIRNSAKQIGTFSNSNKLFNNTFRLIDWAIKSNMVSLFTDCPHREKLGWLEQTYLMGSSAHFNYDISGICKKMIEDMKSAQYENGKIPEIVPEFTKFTPPFDDSPEWSSAAIILPWYNYKWYADFQTLQDAYPMMQKYICYLKSKSDNNILNYGLSDWFDIGKNKSGFSQLTRMGVTATTTYYYNVGIMKKVAKLLDKNDDVQYYHKMENDIKIAFNNLFFNRQKINYDTLSQTELAMALYVDIVKPENKKEILNALALGIKNNEHKLTSGDIGYRYLLRVLEDNGESELIYKMNCNDNVPGYGFQIKNGATALTESWQAYPSVSNNHFMLGHLLEWFYSGLVGIKQTENSVGYKHVIIQPNFLDSINNAKANFTTNYGEIKCFWKKNGNKIYFEINIPTNSDAEIVLNSNYVCNKKNKLFFNQSKLESNKIKIGSGNYIFEIVKK